GVSALLASRLAARFGLVRTMVFTHLPSNILLILVPLMPSLPLAILVLLARFSISQMDVPTRQSYLMAVVGPEERSAAGGVTGVARTIGAALAPVFAGFLYARLLGIFVSQHPPQRGGNDLPGQAILVLQPTALILSTARRQLLPQLVHLRLRLAIHE